MRLHATAIDAKTITRRKRMQYMAPLHAQARRIGMNPIGSELRSRWRQACVLYPGDDGIKDDLAEDILRDTGSVK